MRANSRSSVYFFFTLAVILLCISALIEGPERTDEPIQAVFPAQTAIQAAPHEDAQSAVKKSRVSAESRALRFTRFVFSPRLPTGPERDENGLPVIRGAYREAAYLKCPPEGLPG